MKFAHKEGQGFPSITDEETGRVYPLIMGGSEGATAPTPSEGNGGEGTVTPPAEEPQSTPEGGGGQEFYAKYLNDVPEDVRPQVEQVLEKYRSEQDANFNKKLEKQAEETRVPMTLYNALMEAPIETIDWIADQFEQERDLNIREQMLQRWGIEMPNEDPGQESSEDQPMTKAELEEWYQQRREQEAQEAQQQQTQQQQIQQQRQTVQSWIESAAKNYGLELEGENDPVLQTIIMQANDLHSKGTARGQAAVEMATEALAKRLGVKPKENKGEEPTLADGGTAPPSKDIDLSDPKQRKARMAELFEPAKTS